MYFRLTIKTDYDAVFCINGSFTEARRPLNLRRDEVYYVTVFPLCAALLPYTVKIVDGKARSNEKLATLCALRRDEYTLKLAPQYGFVFAAKEANARPAPLPVLFFNAVKERNAIKARALLTGGLSSSVGDDALLSFFDGFKDIIIDDDEYFLISDDDNATRYSFSIKDGLIDDVNET